MPAIAFDEVQGLVPVEPNTYLCSVKEAKTGVSKSGNEKIDLQWQIEEGPFTGRIIFDTLVWHEKALFRVKQTLIAFGYEENFSGNVEAEDLIGNSALLVVDIEESTQLDDTGEPYPPRNRVRRVKPVS